MTSNICPAEERETEAPATFGERRVGALAERVPEPDRLALLPASPDGLPDATARAAVATRSPDETARHGSSRKFRKASRVGMPQLLTAFVHLAAACRVSAMKPASPT
jgi:hypothetical protein